MVKNEKSNASITCIKMCFQTRLLDLISKISPQSKFTDDSGVTRPDVMLCNRYLKLLTWVRLRNITCMYLLIIYIVNFSLIIDSKHSEAHRSLML